MKKNLHITLLRSLYTSLNSFQQDLAKQLNDLGNFTRKSTPLNLRIAHLPIFSISTFSHLSVSEQYILKVAFALIFLYILANLIVKIIQELRKWIQLLIQLFLVVFLVSISIAPSLFGGKIHDLLHPVITLIKNLFQL